MAETITTSEVLDGFSTSASTADLTAYIAVVDQADACLDANSVPAAIQKHLKILGVRHLAANSNDRGNVIEEEAVSGARRVYSDKKSGDTAYLETLRSIDRYGCVTAVLNYNARVQFRSVGRRSMAT